MIVVIMGVSGSGKTTIGTMLADAIHSISGRRFTALQREHREDESWYSVN